MARTTGVAKNVTGTCGQAATAECFSQPGENGRAGYFCARTREQCDMRRIIQGTQLPASPCITAVPGRTNGETTGGHEAAGEADSDNIWYCFEQDDNGGGGDQRPGFPLCFARKGECQSIRGRLHADHRAVTRCAMNQGAYCVPFEGEGRTQLICTATANDCATMRRKMGEGGKVNVAACSPARGCGAGAVPCPQ